MPRSIQAIVAIVLVSAIFHPPADASSQLMNGQQVEIVKVSEGEVFLGRIVETGEKIDIRLLGVDCPNSEDRPASTFARENLVGQITVVTSERPPIPPAMDQYDRWVVYLELENGSDYGEALLEAGHCTARTWSMKHPRKSDYDALSG